MSRNLRTNSIKYLILNYIYSHRNHALKRPKIFFGINIPTSNAAVFNKTFELVKSMPYIIVKEDTVQWDPRYFIGKLHVNHIEFVYRNKDKFLVSYHNMLHPMDGDEVVIAVEDERRLTGNVVDVIKRTTKAIRGTVSRLNDTIFIVPEDKKRYKHDIYIPDTDIDNYTKVEIKLDEFDTKLKPAGVIQRKIRSVAEDNERNKRAILAKYGFSYKFSNEELEEAMKIKKKISNNAYNDSVIVDVPVFLINDNYYADMAYSAKKNADKTVDITIYIPDIAAKISEGSKLDKAALSRGIACNLNGEIVDIFPKELLEERLMFSEGQKRLAIAFKLTFDTNGHRVNYDVFEAVITPCKAINSFDLIEYLKYRDEVFETSYYSIIDELFTLIDTYELINKDCLSFNTSNRVDRVENGHIVTNSSKTMDDMAYLFGMECEKITAEILHSTNFPAIHSYKTLPSMFDIKRLQTQCSVHGIALSDVLKSNNLSPKDVTELINSIFDTDIQHAILVNINNMTSENGFSSQKVYNFMAGTITCPIVNPSQNYAALYNQRLIRRYIMKTLFNDNVMNNVLGNIDEICEILTVKENQRRKIESEYLNILLVEAMKNDDVQEVLAYSVTPSGVYVQVAHGLVGLVKFEDYEISDKEFVFFIDGERHVIKLGDKFNAKFSHYDIKSNRLVFTYEK